MAGKSYLIRVGELELPAISRPGDEALTGLVCQQLQQELPQLDGARACKCKQTHAYTFEQ